MPSRRRRRITIQVDQYEHTAWRILAAREGLSLAEWLRRTANRQLGASAQKVIETLRALDDKGELAWVGLGTMFCFGRWCYRAGLYEHLF